jgi:hypothetical protein
MEDGIAADDILGDLYYLIYQDRFDLGGCGAFVS